MTNHTLEPWVADNDLGCKAIKGNKGGTHKQAQYAEIAWTVGLANEARDKANAARIVACVNACAGINPEAVGDLKSVLTAALEWWGLERPTSPTGTLPTWVADASAALAKAKLP